MQINLTGEDCKSMAASNAKALVETESTAIRRGLGKYDCKKRKMEDEQKIKKIYPKDQEKIRLLILILGGGGHIFFSFFETFPVEFFLPVSVFAAPST